MSNRRDNQFTWNPHNRATVLDCSFIVDSTNGNGFGVRSLKKSGRVASVFMNTSSTPGTASNGQVNPNPIAGLIQVTLQDNYNAYLGGYSGFVSPVSGTPINISTGSSLSLGHLYVIVTLGTTTQAQWQAVGLSSSIKAAVGVSFIATATSGSGTGVVEAFATAGSNIDHIEVVGDSNLMNNSLGATIVGGGIGMIVQLACFKANALTAPAAGTVIGLNFYLNNSAQGV